MLKLPVMNLKGSPEKIGRAVGLKFKALIHKEVKVLFDNLRFLSPLPLTKEHCLKLSGKYFPYAQKYAPELVEEIEGISDGAGLGLEEVFFLNCYLDISSDLFRPKMAFELLGCSSLAASGKATADKEVIIGQNFDVNVAFQDSSILLAVRTKLGASSLIYTLAGLVGCVGINSNGISVMNNTLFSSGPRPGVPFAFIVRKILAQKTIGEALDAVLKARRATGMNYLLSNPKGEIYDLETTASKAEVISPQKDYICHTNHFLSSKLKRYEIVKLENSINRWTRIKKILGDCYGKLTPELFKEILADHKNYPNSICYHSDPRSTRYRRLKTVSSIICLPRAKKMIYTNGNPCESDFIEHSL